MTDTYPPTLRNVQVEAKGSHSVISLNRSNHERSGSRMRVERSSVSQCHC